MATTQRDITEPQYEQLPWRADCSADKTCKFGELFPTEQAALHAEQTHTHDPRGQVQYQHYGVPSSIWVELDAVIVKIRANAEPDNLENLKGYANGLAFGILRSTGWKPPYSTIQDVLKEAMRRWKMHTGLAPWEPTPSYRFWSPPPGVPMHDNASRLDRITFTKPHNAGSAPAAPAAPVRPRTPAPKAPARQAVKVSRNMSLAEQDMLRTAYNVNKFDIEQCMAMFKLSQSEVESILAAG